MFGSKTKLLWRLHDELRERGVPADECLVVNMSRLPGYFVGENRGVPQNFLLVDVNPNNYLAIFVSGEYWEYMEMYSAGDRPLPSKMNTEIIGLVGKSIAQDVLALLRQKQDEVLLK